MRPALALALLWALAGCSAGAGQPAEPAAVPAEVEIDWPDAASHRPLADAGPGQGGLSESEAPERPRPRARR